MESLLPNISLNGPGILEEVNFAASFLATRPYNVDRPNRDAEALSTKLTAKILTLLMITCNQDFSLIQLASRRIQVKFSHANSFQVDLAAQS